MAKAQPFDFDSESELDSSISESQSTETFYVRDEADLKKLPPQVRQLFEQARKAAAASGGLRLVSNAEQAQFDVDFIQRAEMIIDAVRQGEETGEWDMARGFMSPRLYNRWLPWAQGLLRTRSATPSIVNRQITPYASESQATHDSMTVRLAESSPATATVRTLWVFLRNASARTSQPGAVFAGICTNCGAPVDPTQTSTCRYCGAGVINLGPEWLLDDIRPDQETSPS